MKNYHDTTRFAFTCNNSSYIIESKRKNIEELGLDTHRFRMQSFPISRLSDSTGIKPSFDTKVILAHAVGNAIISSILSFIDPASDDTDADLLKDADEVNIWVSNPADVDTDNDGNQRNDNTSVFENHNIKKTIQTIPA